MPPDEALDRAERLRHAAGQYPIATCFSCSESRIARDLLFGRGPGELLMSRDAGYTLCTSSLRSFVFAVPTLQVPLIVIMRHERCGAVKDADIRGSRQLCCATFSVPFTNGDTKHCLLCWSRSVRVS
ncbi:carbonic anhydrase [Croceicoccus esteveae]|uniref:carbonic anhydrase n=1 Tax=Croceicoccus esteveae TaxID=3075597 RepID=UPI003D78275B